MLSKSTTALALSAILFTATMVLGGPSDEEQARHNLPSGATLEMFTRVFEDGHTGTLPALASGQKTALGNSPSLAFIFKRNGLLGLRVLSDQAPGGSFATLDAVLPGTYPQRLGGFAAPLAISALVPNHAPFIFAATSDGASVGTYLSMFYIRNGTLISATGSALDGSSIDVECARKDLREVPCKILSWGKWTDHSSAWVRVWTWNGDIFQQNDAEIPAYRTRKLNEMETFAASEARLGVYLRVADATLLAGEYSEDRNFAQALRVTDRILARLEVRDSNLPRSNAPAMLTADIENGKAAIYELRSKVYHDMGRPADSASELKRAQQIRTEMAR